MFGYAKAYISTLLKVEFDQPDFPRADGGNVGTHSIRKFPAKYAQNKGYNRDDVEERGMWKSKQQIVHTYIGTKIPYPDSKVASVFA